MEDEPKPKELARPKKENPRLKRLYVLHKAIGQLIALESASSSKRLVVDGDLVVPFPEELKAKIRRRVREKTNKLAVLVQELEDDGETEADELHEEIDG